MHCPLLHAYSAHGCLCRPSWRSSSPPGPSLLSSGGAMRSRPVSDCTAPIQGLPHLVGAAPLGEAPWRMVACTCEWLVLASGSYLRVAPHAWVEALACASFQECASDLPAHPGPSHVARCPRDVVILCHVTAHIPTSAHGHVSTACRISGLSPAEYGFPRRPSLAASSG